MGVLDKARSLFSRKNALSQYGNLHEADFWTNLSVNHALPNGGDVMSVMAALRAGTVIAQGIGQVPLHVKHEKFDGKHMVRRNAVDERSYRLLNRRPNDWMTSVELREALTMHAVFTGAGRAIIRRGVDGRPLEILPLHPRWVEAKHDTRTGEYIYDVGVAEYGIYGRFTRDDILEVTNPRWDFVNGLDVTRRAASALGLARDIEARQAKLASGSSPYGILSVEDANSTERVNKLKVAWTKQFGAGNGIGIVDFGAKFQQMAGSPADQQAIENRRFQIEEVSRAFGVFPAMLMSTDKAATFASAQEFFAQHIVHTMRPWFMRWEQALDRCFFDESKELNAKFDELGLFRSSQADRADYLSRALGSGGNMPWMTINEAREHDGLNPIEGGDILPGLQESGEDGKEVPQV